MRSSLPIKARTLLLASFLSVLGFASSRAHAEATTMHIPATGADCNPCVPPGSYVSGHFQMTIRFTLTTTGMHIGTVTNSCGAKVITPIGEFVSNDTSESETNINFGAALEWTEHQTYKYTSPGRGENYRMDALLHMTVNANGEVTAEVEKLVIDCFDGSCCGN
jgi:hypothetical protein